MKNTNFLISIVLSFILSSAAISAEENQTIYKLRQITTPGGEFVELSNHAAAYENGRSQLLGYIETKEMHVNEGEFLSTDSNGLNSIWDKKELEESLIPIEGTQMGEDGKYVYNHDK